MPALNPIHHLQEFTKQAHHFMTKDLQALPEDKQNACPGGCARTPLNVIAECAMVHRMVGDFLRTGKAERIPAEERDAHLNSFDTMEKALAYLDRETQYLLGVLETLDENTLGDVSEEPLGFPMTRFGLAQLPAMHMMYHDGQLNYIQSLYGDDKVHWRD